MSVRCNLGERVVVVTVRDAAQEAVVESWNGGRREGSGKWGVLMGSRGEPI